MIYFIQEGKDGPIKVGHSSDPEARLAALQTGNSKTLHLRRTVKGGNRMEQELHSELEHLRLREDGEWFGPSEKVLQLASQLGRVPVATEGGYTHPVLYRPDPTTLTMPCPFCGRRHGHGAADGHRVAHCRSVPWEKRWKIERETGEKCWYVDADDGNRYYSKHGYIIKTDREKYIAHTSPALQHDCT
jgi:hypothetical protein